jgi:hypothetical protein
MLIIKTIRFVYVHSVPICFMFVIMLCCLIGYAGSKQYPKYDEDIIKKEVEGIISIIKEADKIIIYNSSHKTSFEANSRETAEIMESFNLNNVGPTYDAGPIGRGFYGSIQFIKDGKITATFGLLTDSVYKEGTTQKEYKFKIDPMPKILKEHQQSETSKKDADKTKAEQKSDDSKPK